MRYLATHGDEVRRYQREWAAKNRPTVWLDSPAKSLRHDGEWSYHEVTGESGLWSDPTFEAACDRIYEATQAEKEEVWQWNLDHRQPRVKPIDTTIYTQMPGAGNGLTHRLSSRHRGRNAQRALMAGKRIAQKPRAKR